MNIYNTYSMRNIKERICLDIFMATKLYEVFSGEQPCQYINMFRHFEDQLCPHLQGSR
jgi:hypothetical protein